MPAPGQAIVVRPKAVWRWGFPVGTVGLAVWSAFTPDPLFGLVFVVPGLVAVAVVWMHRIVVDEEAMTVLHHRPPLPARHVRIDGTRRLTCHMEGRGKRARVRLRIYDDRGGRIVVEVWIWSAWRPLARAVAVHAPADLVLDTETGRYLRLVRKYGRHEYVPPDPEA